MARRRNKPKVDKSKKLDSYWENKFPESYIYTKAAELRAKRTQRLQGNIDDDPAPLCAEEHYFSVNKLAMPDGRVSPSGLALVKILSNNFE